MSIPLSLLDLALIGEDRTAAEAFDATVALARRAEELGVRRIWYAEHHNMPSVASSATSVLIAHVAAHTSTIRLGAGGIMLPNHAPLVIAEQFGTLATLHPGRIDLGLGRAPGTDQTTLRALRRDPTSADRFPDDVLELQGYLAGRSRVPGINAVPGAGTDVPLYILGSSLFGATLAAKLGLPYAFASHFAPAALEAAVSAYRRGFEPSEANPEPHVIAGVNVLIADDEATAAERLHEVKRRRLKLLFPQLRNSSPEELDLALDSPAGHQVEQMVRYTAVGTPDQVARDLAVFADHADADELMVVLNDPDRSTELHSLDLLAKAVPDHLAAPTP